MIYNYKAFMLILESSIPPAHNSSLINLIALLPQRTFAFLNFLQDNGSLNKSKKISPEEKA